MIGTAMLFLSIFFLDSPLATFFKKPELESIYYYSREITNIGYSIHYFFIALFGLIFSKFLFPRFSNLQNKITLKQNNKIMYWSCFLLKALLLVAIPLHILKFCIGRLRPHMSENFNNLNFDPFTLQHHWQSFPSGHSQVLFTVATTAALIWPKYRNLFLFLALFLAFTRVTIQQHFLSDVIAGALVGYLGTIWLHHYSPNKLNR